MNEAHTSKLNGHMQMISRLSAMVAGELAADGIGEAEAVSLTIDALLLVAAHHAVSQAFDEGRAPDLERWRKATDAAVQEAIKFMLAKAVEKSPPLAPQDEERDVTDPGLDPGEASATARPQRPAPPGPAAGRPKDKLRAEQPRRT